MNYFVMTYPYNIFVNIELKEIVWLITFAYVKTNENFMERQKCQKSYAF